jgi:ubiquinone/menaquinone biosynthesis C-methylase UbiE
VTISVDYLDAVDALDTARRYKAHALRCLAIGPGDRVLEVGCGTGRDALALAARVAPEGAVLGIDLSADVIAEARRRAAASGLPVRFEMMDGANLGAVPDASFDAARLDRVLHMLAAPLEVLREVVRVVRPGGRVVVSEPDWTTLTLDCDQPALSARVLAHARAQADSPGQGRCLSRLCATAGLVERALHPWAGSVTRYQTAQTLVRLDAIAQAAVADQVISAAEQLQWLASLIRADRLGTFHVSMMLFTVAAIVPGGSGASAG